MAGTYKTIGGSVRVRLLMAAVIAAASIAGGAAAHAAMSVAAQNASNSSPWFFSPASSDDASRVAADSLGPPPLEAGFDFRAAPFASPFGVEAAPFAFAVQGPLGSITTSGYSETATVPHILSGGLIARDGSYYTVRDLEIVDRLSPDVAIELGYNLDLAGRFNLYDAGPSDLFLSASAVDSPYAALADGGSYIGSTVRLANGLSVRFGESILEPGTPDLSLPLLSNLARASVVQWQTGSRSAQTTLAGVNWQFAPWGGLGLTGTQTAERNGLLGSSGPLSPAGSANTTALGVSARVGFGGGWVTTFAYNEGITQLDLRPSGNAVASTDTLHSRSYGVAIAKHGLFGDDSLALAVTRPIEVYSGNVDLGVQASPDPFDALLSGSGRLAIAGQTPETDLELGYVTTFLDGALALQANAGYQMNLAGQPGSNGVAVLSRAKINF